MNLKQAIDICKSNIGDRKIIGYWEVQGSFIFNTRGDSDDPGRPGPAQYIVRSDGKCYATNPLQFPSIRSNNMKQLYFRS